MSLRFSNATSLVFFQNISDKGKISPLPCPSWLKAKKTFLSRTFLRNFFLCFMTKYEYEYEDYR